MYKRRLAAAGSVTALAVIPLLAGCSSTSTAKVPANVQAIETSSSLTQVLACLGYAPVSVLYRSSSYAWAHCRPTSGGFTDLTSCAAQLNTSATDGYPNIYEINGVVKYLQVVHVGRVIDDYGDRTGSATTAVWIGLPGELQNFAALGPPQCAWLLKTLAPYTLQVAGSAQASGSRMLQVVYGGKQYAFKLSHAQPSDVKE
jgi:hypothetical protein